MINIGPIELLVLLVVLMFLFVVAAGVAASLYFLVRRFRSSTEFEAGRRIPCPFCAEMILPNAKICRYCGRELSEKPA